MKRLVELKKSLLSKITLRELFHYRKDLRELLPSDLDLDKNQSPLGKDLAIVYSPKPPDSLLKLLNSNTKFLIQDDTSCLLAMYKGKLIGRIFLNLKGKGSLLYPFEYELNFGKKHVYSFDIFVKEKFRGYGLGKRLYIESFKALKDKFDYIDIFVDAKKFIPNKLPQDLGFKKVKKMILFRFFNFKFKYNLNTQLKNIAYNFLLGPIKFLSRIAGVIYHFFVLSIKSMDNFVNHFFLDAYIINGLQGNGKLRLAFISETIPEKSLLNRIFPSGCNVEKKKNFLKKRLSNEVNNFSKVVDMVIVDGRFNYLYRLTGSIKDIVFVPQWIVQINSEFKDLSIFARRRNRNAYDDIRSVKRYGYDYTFTKERKLLFFFYEHMYFPYMRNRYKEEKVDVPFKLIEKSFKKGGLLLVKNKEKYLAASVVEITNKKFHPKFSGILNGETGLLKKDVLCALYYFYFLEAQNKGCPIVDLGLSKAFLNDGVLKYKVKWNTKIEFDKRRSNIYAFKFCRSSEAVKNFLINNPFISIEGNNLAGNVFFDSDDGVAQDEAIKMYQLNGLSELRIRYLDGNGFSFNDKSVKSKTINSERRLRSPIVDTLKVLGMSIYKKLKFLGSQPLYAIERASFKIPLLSNAFLNHYATYKFLIFKLRLKFNILKTPAFVQWLVTYKCNFACQHCEASANERKVSELTTNEAIKLVDELSAMNVKTIVISGGEPLVRKDIFKIIQHILRRRMQYAIASNGYLVSCFKEEFSKMKPCLFLTSIDGLEHTNDNLRGKTGAFNSSFRALEFFKTIGVQDLRINTVVCPSNINQIENLKKIILKSAATFWRLIIPTPVGRAKDDESLCLNDEQIRYLFDFVKATRRKFNIEISETAGCLGHLELKVRSDPFFCGAGITRCAVMPDGEVLGCQIAYDNRFSEGNIRNKAFEDIWRQGFSRFRNPQFDEECLRCGFFHACRGGCWGMRLYNEHCFKSIWDGKK